MCITGVAAGPIVSRVTAEVEVVGSSLTRKSCSFLRIDRPKARQRDLAKVDANRRA